MNFKNYVDLKKEISETLGSPIIDDSSIVKISCRNVNIFYNKNTQVIFDINLDIAKNQVLAMIGPSGCGKSTLLRAFNRMNDTIEDCVLDGCIKIDDENIYSKEIDPVHLRTKIGMVFQKPNPFPKSIYDNVAYGPRIHGLTQNKAQLNDIVEESLTKAGLWDETKDRLNKPGTGLSGGQQQRLCIARAIAVKPEIILMDEPTSALDPIATDVIEQLIFELKSSYTIIIVTHSMQQAARISDRAAYFHLGKLVEVNDTSKFFTNPSAALTEKYITGRFG